MANSLNDIVIVNIDIAQPAVDSSSFDNLLIVGPAPLVAPSNPLPAVGAYSGLEEVADAGYTTTGDGADPVGIAARIAFSQNPKPSRIYIAAQQKANPDISNAAIKIITEDNYFTDAIGADPDGALPADLPWLQITYSRSAVGSMEATITKDGAIVYGNSLPTDANPNAYLQVCLGTSQNPQADQMNLDPADFQGTYSVTLTATRGARTSTITASVAFDGVSAYTPGAISVTTSPVNQTPVEVLETAIETTGWYVICPAGIAESEYERIAEWTEAHIKQFAYTFLQKSDPVGSVYYRSHGWCGLVTDNDLPEDVPEANAYLHCAIVAKALSYPAGSETWAFKTLAAVYPSNLSSTLKKLITEGHSNYFAQYAGRNISMNAQVRAGEWIDVIRGRDWLQNDMQLRIYNLLIMNPKIPFTNSGIALVQNEMIASLKTARGRGIVAEDEYDEDGNLIPGFTTSVPNSMSLTATQKASRVLSDCRFSARLAGAIHAVQVNGVLTY